MADIRVDIDGLRRNAQSLNGKLEQLRSINSQFETLINTIGDSWHGQASAAYISKLREHLAQGRTLEQVLQSCISYANQTASDYANADSQGASNIDNSF